MIFFRRREPDFKVGLYFFKDIFFFFITKCASDKQLQVES